MNTKLRLILTLLALFPLLWACEPVSEDQKPANENLVVNSDQEALDEFITLKDEAVEVDEVDSGPSGKPGLQKSKKLPDETQLTLIAEISAPQHEGVTLQATEVHINGSKAYVSYNVQGEVFMGAVDIIKINDEDDPELASRIIFTDSDIHGIERLGNTLYLAAGTRAAEYPTPAVLKVLQLDEAFIIDPDTEITTINLPSYAATDVDVLGNYIYVASGAEGGAISVLDKSDLSITNTINIEDPRGISTWRGTGLNGVSVITGGDDSKLVFIDESNPSELTDDVFDIDGATNSEAKATVERNKSITLLAAGEGGMQVVCNDDFTLVGELAVPTGVLDGEGNLLDDDKTTTNAASASGRFAYMANGEAGVYMAMLDGKFDGNSCDMSGLEVIGKLSLGDEISANHVTAKNDLLFVASGIGGLKILRVDDSSIEQEDEDDDDN